MQSSAGPAAAAARRPADRLAAAGGDPRPGPRRTVDLAEVLAPVLQRLGVAHPDAVIEAEVARGAAWPRSTPTGSARSSTTWSPTPSRYGAQPGPGGRPARCGDEVEVTVRDAGPGVPPELREPALRAVRHPGRRSGTGLGLHIVRELARAQGGDATYRRRRRTRSWSAFPERPERAVTVRVLLVDDVADVRRLVRIALRFHGGFEVVGEAGPGSRPSSWPPSCGPTSCCWTSACPTSPAATCSAGCARWRPSAKVVVFTGADTEDRA